MSKKNKTYVYRDSNVSYSEPITIVTGNLTLGRKLENKLKDSFEKVSNAFDNVFEPENIYDTIVNESGDVLYDEIIDKVSSKVYVTTSHSKCDPHDKFDPKIGLIVASRKVEKKLLKQASRDVQELILQLRKMLVEAKDTEKSLEKRINNIEKYLLGTTNTDA